MPKFAAIQYAGIPGSSKDCQDAVLRFLQFGDHITSALVLTCDRNHCLLLTINVGDRVAIKSGFASGYPGEGPRTLSYTLKVLETFGIEIDEVVVSSDLLERLDDSCLTISDMKTIDSLRRVRPARWYDYIIESHWELGKSAALWRYFPDVMPMALIDSRLIDLAIGFWDGPDDRLLKGYRRLEDLVRKKAGIDEHGQKLFAQAFAKEGGKLGWGEIDGGEHTGRMQLFTSAYLAYRNPRSHREEGGHATALEEFLLLNHLFGLEGKSNPVAASPDETKNEVEVK